MQHLISDNQDFEDVENSGNFDKHNIYDGMPYSAASSAGPSRMNGNNGKQMPDPNDESTKKYISGYRDLLNHKK